MILIAAILKEVVQSTPSSSLEQAKQEVNKLVHDCHHVSQWITTFITREDSSDLVIYSDAGGRTWTIPPDTLPTSNRPDRVGISRSNKWISIFELTVSYEGNFSKYHNYKCLKYAQPVIDRNNCGFKVTFFAMEIGCRLIFSENDSKGLHAFYHSIPGIKFHASYFNNSLCKTAGTSSFITYITRFPLILNI